MSSTGNDRHAPTNGTTAYEAIEREHHTISTEQVRTIFRRLNDLEERVESLERDFSASAS